MSRIIFKSKSQSIGMVYILIVLTHLIRMLLLVFCLTYHPDRMDGVVGVTQCGIPSGTSYTYNFTIPDHQHGTFWYHGHSGLTRADGLYGGLVVHEPASRFVERGLLANPSSYSKDFLLLIGDWYHRPAVEVMSWYMRAGSFGNDVHRSLSTWAGMID